MTIEFDEKGKIYTDVIRKTPKPVTIQTETHRIEGNIHLRGGERLKDALNCSELFLAVTDATMTDLRGEVLQRCDFIAVNLEHILWVIPGNNHPSTKNDRGDQ